MLITILGSCRQDSLYEKYVITSIKENISYTHYTKEILEVINYCKFGNIDEEETKFVFRKPILNNTPLKFSKKIKNEFENTDIFIIEIASRKYYKYNERYVHHVLIDSNEKIKENTEINYLSNEEIENDIIKIKEELKKPLIIVSHILTYENSKRNDLIFLLENRHDQSIYSILVNTFGSIKLKDEVDFLDDWTNKNEYPFLAKRL